MKTTCHRTSPTAEAALIEDYGDLEPLLSRVEAVVDPEAPPGNVVPALARLLIAVALRQQGPPPKG